MKIRCNNNPAREHSVEYPNCPYCRIEALEEAAAKARIREGEKDISLRRFIATIVRLKAELETMENHGKELAVKHQITCDGLEQAQLDRDHYMFERDDYAKALDREQGRKEAAKAKLAAMRPYLQHRGDCAARKHIKNTIGRSASCFCGLDNIRAALEAILENSNE